MLRQVAPGNYHFLFVTRVQLIILMTRKKNFLRKLNKYTLVITSISKGARRSSERAS